MKDELRKMLRPISFGLYFFAFLVLVLMAFNSYQYLYVPNALFREGDFEYVMRNCAIWFFALFSFALVLGKLSKK